MGYTAMKFDPFGQHNYYTISPEEAQLAEDRVAAVRDAVGPNVEILVEVHAKFNVYTAIHLGQRLEQYRPFWFEEPVSQENVGEMAQVRQRVNIPIATGERLYLKFPFYELVKADAVDILQPDMCNAGGITELKKIAAIAEAAPRRHGSAQHQRRRRNRRQLPPRRGHAQLPHPGVPRRVLRAALLRGLRRLPRQRDGYVELPTGPGLGLTFNEEVADAHPYLPLGVGERGI